MQNYMFKNLILPLYYNYYKKQNRLKYYYQLKNRDSLSQEQLLEIQWKKLKKLIDHCYTNIPYYKKLFLKLDIHPEDIKSLKDYSKIPELKKQNIRDNYNELIDPNLPKNQICYSATGGSTGIPLKIYKGLEDQEYGFALRYRSNAWCGWKIWNKSAWFVSDLRRLTELDTTKRKMGLFVKRKLMLDTRDTNEASMFKWVEQIKNSKPEYVYGYTTLLTEFAKFVLDNNINIKEVKGVFGTAEPLTEREIISQAFNAPVYDQYGSSEIPCVGHECVKGNMHINIDEVLVEFINMSEDSNIRKIVCTPLYAYGMPLLRYDLGDCAAPSSGRCCCGLPYPVMKLKVSRVSDNLLSPSGRIVATSNFGWHIAHVTKGVKQFQLIQEDLYKFVVKIISDQEFRVENEIAITELLQGLLGITDLNIEFEYLEKIPACNSGKSRPVISKVIEKTH